MIKEKKYSDYENISKFILSKIKNKVDIALVLGTALGSISNDLEERIEIKYEDIPGFLVSTVKSHAGKLIYGKLNGKYILCFSGRFHYYEGYDFSELAMPVYVMKLLGVKTLILTNAAGAINYNFHPGDICVLTDHINFMGVAPTRGNNLYEFGDRFFPINKVYDNDLRELAKKEAVNLGFSLKEGVYFYTTGPHFESPAEIRAMRLLGADMVGMSTITESITAAHCNIKVLALSLATNYSTDRVLEMDGSEVDGVGEEAAPRFIALIKSVVSKL
ncbi:MAG: purine-nucleoside phosphorylase [Oceanivirga sp.]|nr:purine-nucleoside phosphorylase [Oceanivirga sp.]